MNHTLPFRLARTARAVAIVLAGASSAAAFAQAAADTINDPRAKDDAVRIGTIVITGQGDRLGAGQILKEDATKARSTVTRAATEKDRATGNSFQAMALLPSVNTFSHDATGLYGGSISVRGFTADQLGVTINGVPVNDSGSYSVFPQEYSDQENLCIQSLAPGAPDVESPHIGASGGSISMVTCDPEDKRRFRVSQTLGGLNTKRTFVRADSGRFANDMAKVFLSYSHSEGDKWKGAGKAKRDHIDMGFALDASADLRVVGSVLYNKAINNNFLAVTLSQLNSGGYYFDYSKTFPGHAAARPGLADVDTAPNPVYYGLSLGPFENVIASVSASWRVTENTLIKVQPYYWYGYGTGSTQQRLQAENKFYVPATKTYNGTIDLNGDGDTLDSVIVANSSITRTQRPGITGEISYNWGAHLLKAGVWYEHTVHRQTGPMVRVDSQGNPVDPWLREGQIILADGQPFQSRNWLTYSPAFQLYLADTFNFDNDKGVLNVGLRAPHMTRNVSNYASSGNASGTTPSTAVAPLTYNNTYSISKGYSAVLPQLGLRYNLTREHQVFANISKNFRAGPNFAFTPSNGNVVLKNGQPSLEVDIAAETSVATDLGYRYQSKDVTASLTYFHVDFRDRQSNAFDPEKGLSVYTNVGKTIKHGLEFEAGTAVFGGISAYASATVQQDRIKSNLQVIKDQILPTAGKMYTQVPHIMFGGSLQYASGPVYMRLKGKYTGAQYSTLMNDELVPAYTLFDVDMGYKFADAGMLKNPMIRMNISNLTGEQYRNPSSGQTNAVAYGTRSAQTVSYYLGAPRMLSLTFSADF